MFLIESTKDIKNVLNLLKLFYMLKEDSGHVHELFSILIYLYGNYKLNRLDIPCAIVKCESPDFRLLCYEKEKSRGIEHTTSTLKDYKMAESELQNLPLYSKLEPDHYSPFHKLKKKEIFSGLKLPIDELTGQGYSGNRPEKEWAEIIKLAFIGKTQKLNSKYEKYTQNELIIEDDSPVESTIDLYDALIMLKPHVAEYLASSSYAIKYDKIHIISKNIFVYDVLYHNRIVNFSRETLFPVPVLKKLIDDIIFKIKYRKFIMKL